jgi:hypothetical protein
MAGRLPTEDKTRTRQTVKLSILQCVTEFGRLSLVAEFSSALSCIGRNSIARYVCSLGMI